MSIKQAIVTTKSGKLEGVERKGLYVFKGIPFAAPPVGKLRWMPPQPVKPWQGVRPAKEYAAVSPQPLMPGGTAIGTPSFAGQEQSEDCLFLNVWTPGLDDGKRPVFLWIHGGAFYIGSGTEGFLDEGVLARRTNIVIVSINYRLGAFGFLNLKELTGGKIPATGNEGILDQVAALDWIQANIAAFGGDPSNVTISGFSAGGMSVGALLGMPAARGKYHKALNRSGAANIIGTLEGAVNIANKQLDIFGVKASDIDGLRALTTARILEGQGKLIELMRQAEGRATPYQPVVDGVDLPEPPMSAIKKGAAAGIPILSGTSLDELKMMTVMDPSAKNMDEPALFKKLGAMVPPRMVSGIIESYKKALKQRGGSVTPGDIFGSINTDWMFRVPTIRLVELQQDNGAPAYNYLFTYKCPAMGGVLGAMHGLDNPFLFGALTPEFTGKDDELEALAVRMQDSAAAFMRTGDPSCQSNGKWPVYGKNRMTMLFDRKSRCEAAPYEIERAAWDGFEYLQSKPV
jgi:para-nitrobenzyl esterase